MSTTEDEQVRRCVACTDPASCSESGHCPWERGKTYSGPDQAFSAYLDSHVNAENPDAPEVPGGDCPCGRGEVSGTLTHTSGRLRFRAFHDGPESWHHENSADWACLDCVADTAATVASGEVREDMRRVAHEQPAT